MATTPARFRVGEDGLAPLRSYAGPKTPRSFRVPTGFIHMGWYGSGVNDPSAGSPTETLLRLLLPLNDKVQATSRR